MTQSVKKKEKDKAFKLTLDDPVRKSVVSVFMGTITCFKIDQMCVSMGVYWLLLTG